ncbi:MAG: hypothetical protein GY803_08830 [Chloroflexi bacterium]|nr:hypothetical protein [Chloroflexota bacterium]
MRIYFERSGGFFGRPMTCEVDTETMPAEEAIALQEMVTSASFFEMPQSSSEARDQFQYKLIVEAEKVKYTVETTDTAAPDSLRPLLRRLTIMTRSSSSTLSP